MSCLLRLLCLVSLGLCVSSTVFAEDCIECHKKETPAAVTHGSLTVKVNENPTVTPNSNVAMNGNQTVVTPAAPTLTPNSQISVDQPNVRAFVFDAGVSLSSLVDAINAVGASASDLVAILDALHEAGALHAELLVI